MKYYSNKIFYFLITIHILTALFILLYWHVGLALSCWMTKTTFECFYNRMWTNLFIGVIPLLFVVLSGLAIIFQQRGHRRFGYFIIVSAVIFSFYLGYLLRYATWSDIKAIFFMSDRPILGDVFFLAMGMILLLAALIPFYVLGKLVYEDFFKNWVDKF